MLKQMDVFETGTRELSVIYPKHGKSGEGGVMRGKGAEFRCESSSAFVFVEIYDYVFILMSLINTEVHMSNHKRCYVYVCVYMCAILF